MRVLHFYKTAYPHSYGGVEQVIHQLARGCIAHGVAPAVLSLKPSKAGSGTAMPPGYTARAVRRQLQIASMDVSTAAFKKFAARMRQADVIHYHFPWPFMDLVHFAARLLGGKKKPSLVTYHADIVRQKYLLRLYRPLKFLFLNSVDRIVATSPDYLATSPVLQRYRHKVAVIPIGIDRASYPAPSAALLADWRAKLPEKFFLFVGSLRRYKGLHILLEAARGQDWPVIIIGSGAEEAALKAQARDLPQVRFLGALPDDDKMAVLHLCTAFVFPSHQRSEAFGVALLEAAMIGKPLISTRIGTGTSYVNQEGETGLVVPPGDVPALRSAMQLLWGQPALAARYGAAAQARFESLFTADKMAAAYAALYRDMLAAHD